MISSDDSRNKRVVLFVAVLSAFLTPFMGSAVNIALPAIGREFGMDAVLLSWVATSYILSAAMFLLPFGRLADIHGRKRLFTYGLWIYTLASFLSAVSGSAPLLIGSRVLQGVGGAMIFGTGTAILTSVFPAGERGRVLGMTATVVYLGLSLGPFVGGFLTQHFGWRSIFLVNVPLGLIPWILVAWKLKGEWAGARGESFDWVGSVLCSLSLVTGIYGFSLVPAGMGISLILLGALGIWMFARWEMKVENPILDMNLFRNNTVFAFSNLAALIHYSATFAVGFLMSLYLQYVKALSPQSAGLVLVSQPLVMAFFSPWAGRLSDRIEPRIVSSAGMAVTALGLLLLVPLREKTSLEFIVAGLFFLGLGFAFFSSPNTNAVMSSVEYRFYGVASATLGTMRLSGQVVSMGIAMLIFALHIGKVRITPEYFQPFLTGLRTAFGVFAVLCFFGVFASLARGKVR